MNWKNCGEAERYLKLEILFTWTKATCEIVKEDGLTLENPWTQETDTEVIGKW